MIDEQIFFNQPVRNNLRTYDSIQKIVTDQGNDYTTDCLLDHNYFKSYYKTIVIDLSKQHVLDVNPKATKQINFTRNVAQQAIIFFLLKK